MTGRRAFAFAAILLIGVGLLTRVLLIPWPPEVAKYLGSALWGAIIRWLTRRARRRVCFRVAPTASVRN
jgi:hypothetical protein